jgi:SulP family sulfate permease
MSALAALLIFTAYYMSHVQEFKQILSKGSVFDCVVLFATFVLTVFINMIFGIMIGLLLSLLKYLKTNKSIIKSEMIK